MSRWNYDRVQTLLAQLGSNAVELVTVLQEQTPDEFDVTHAFQKVCDLEHDLATIKGLLKRERNSRP